MKQCIKTALLLCFILSSAIAFSQTAEEPPPPPQLGIVPSQSKEAESASGLTLILDLQIDAFRFFNRTYDTPEIRPIASQNSTSVLFPISNRDFTTDSRLTLSYDGKVYGGHFTLNQEALKTQIFGKIGGWVQLGVFRFTLGNDIESIYADPLGADPGMRLYTGSSLKTKMRRDGANFSSENADNITGDDGLLIEAFLDSLTIGLAAGEFEYALGENLGFLQGTNTYGKTEERKFRYGARVGYNHEDNWKLNASYVISGETIAGFYGYKGSEVVPVNPQAESFEHMFGLYGSVYLPSGLDFTLGYAGHLSSVLKEYYGGAGNDEMTETGVPLAFINGLNLNARLKAGELGLRTDNSLSFWKDKDYSKVFEMGEDDRFSNKGLLPKKEADKFAEISHFIMWNGFGASYPIAGNLSADLYLRNLLAIYSASGDLAVGSGEFKLMRDEIGLELKFTYRLHANAEAFITLVAQNRMVSRSKDLNSQTQGFFIATINNVTSGGKKPAAIDTLDNEFSIYLPVGLVLKF